MRDNLRRYRAIRDALKHTYPLKPTGNLARHLTTLAALISGIVGSKSTPLPQIAAKVPQTSTPESRVKRFSRWCDNDNIREEGYFLPSADVLLRQVSSQTVVLVREGRVVGRGWVALMIHVVSKGRALPLAWRVRQGPKGPWPADLHIAVVQLICERIPPGTPVVFLGDGECEGTARQKTRNDAGWSYACRTAVSTVTTWEGDTFRLDVGGSCSKPGRVIALQEARVTREAYGPMLVLCCGAKGYQEPLSLVSNMPTAEEACRW